MNNDTVKLQQERKQIFSDFYNNKLPKRMPVRFQLANHLIAAYGGLNPFDFQFDYAKLEKPAMELAELMYTDTCPIAPIGMLSRVPGFYQILGSQSFAMGDNGFVQHPEVVGMMEDEYPQLIKDPYAFLLETVIPRQYKTLDPKEPIKMLLTLQRAKSYMSEAGQRSMPLVMKLIEEHGYYPGAPMGSGGFCEAPYDFIADQLRSFSGVSMDIRRHRSELKEACEAIMPLMFYWGLPTNPHPEGGAGAPLHMPTFMREKDFEEIWMPTYKTMMEQYAALGVRGGAFCEDNWMRYLDLLLDFPAGMNLSFEYGDPQKIKDKLGKKHIISGLYPINIVKTGTKQQCIDKAKELLDIMLPGGGYLFGFDKAPLTLKDVNLENYLALAEFVHEYAVYPNAGESFGTPVNVEGFKFDEKIIPPIKSKYLFDWDEYKAKYPLTPDSVKINLERMDKELMNFNLSLLI